MERGLLVLCSRPATLRVHRQSTALRMVGPTGVLASMKAPFVQLVELDVQSASPCMIRCCTETARVAKLARSGLQPLAHSPRLESRSVTTLR